MEGENGTASGEGKVTCSAWFRRPENAHLLALGKLKHGGDQTSASLQIFSFDPLTTSLRPTPLTLEFLVSISTDGSSRRWNTIDGVQLASLTHNTDEKIELCRFSKDGTKPFLFRTVQKGGSKDGDVCVVDIKKMDISHWSKRLHLGSSVASLEFCPSKRVLLTTSSEWGAMVTKLSVPADWKEWRTYMVLLGLFLASAVAFYIFFENSNSFWNFPLGKNQPSRPMVNAIFGDPQSEDLGAFGPVDM